MPEGGRVRVIGALSIIAGLVVIFGSWLFSSGVGCGDPWPGCRTIPFNWKLALVGMILLILGSGLFAYLAYKKMKDDRESTPVFISATVFLVLFVVITAVVFNPLISPYDFIRDSDLDGYTDDIDSFPDDKDRYMPTYLEVQISWENTSTNYTARISSVFYILDGEPTDTSVMRLSIVWLPDYSLIQTDEIGILNDIEGSWTDGVMYRDYAPLGLFGENDTFSFDASEFDIAADAYVRDDLGYLITRFTVTA